MKFSLGFASILVTLLVIIAIGHVVIYQAIITFFGVQSPSILLGLKIACVISAISFIGMTMITMASQTAVGSFFYMLSAGWFGTLYWLFLAAILGLGIYIVFKLFGSTSSFPSTLGIILFFVAFGISLYGIMNANKTRVTRYTVAIENLPITWENKTVVMVSDTHLGNVRGSRFVKKVVRLISNQNPAAVLIAGDYYDGPPADYATLAEPLKNIRSEYGVFFAPGNHEEFRDGAIYTETIAAADVYVLSNAMMEIDGLQVVGVNYFSTRTETAQDAILEHLGINPAKPSILIKHVPDTLASASRAGIDLQVSGHTHYGQIWPISLVTKKIYGDYVYGNNLFENTHVITSSGAGTWGPPQRVGTQGEIVVITLQRK